MELHSIKLDVCILTSLHVDRFKIMFETRKYDCDTPVLDLCNSRHNVFQCSISWRTTRAKKIDCAVVFIFLSRQWSALLLDRQVPWCNSFIVAFTENVFKRSVRTKRKNLQKFCLTKFLGVPNTSWNFNSTKSQKRFPTNQCRAKVEFFTTMVKNIFVLRNMTPCTTIDKCLLSEGLRSFIIGLLSWWWGQRVLPVHRYFHTEIHVVICQMTIFHLKWHK